MDDPITQYQVLAGLHVIIGLVWVGSALSAWVGYRAFKQSVDLRWALTFLLFAAGHLGEAYVAYRWTEALDLVTEPMREAATFNSFLRMRLSAILLVAAFIVFYLFRERRKSY